jgi:hypothetical protein
VSSFQLFIPDGFVILFQLPFYVYTKLRQATIDVFSKLLRIRDPETPEVSGQGDDTGFNFRHAVPIAILIVSASYLCGDETLKQVSIGVFSKMGNIYKV